MKELILPYRASGLFTGYYTATVMVSVMTIYFYYQKKYIAFSLSLIFAFFALFFSGRSGFIVLFLFIFYEIIF